MKFYKVTWRDEAAPEATAGEYFTRKKDAQKVVNSLKRTHREEVREAQQAAKAEGDPYWKREGPEDPSPQVETLEFTGTAKQMVLQALQDQFIPY